MHIFWVTNTCLTLPLRQSCHTTVPTYKSCTECVCSPGIIHDRTSDCHPVSWACIYCMDDITTERSLYSRCVGSLMCLAYFLTCYSCVCVCVQPGTDRILVDWCRIYINVCTGLFSDMLFMGVCTTMHRQTSGRLVQDINICTGLFSDMLFMGVCATMHRQTSGQLVQELSVCTVHVGDNHVT